MLSAFREGLYNPNVAGSASIHGSRGDMGRWLTFIVLTAIILAHHANCRKRRGTGRHSRSDCGRSEPLGRIINGEKMSKLQIPWIVYVTTTLRNENGQNQMLRCGGSILTNKVILTAAHCVQRPNETLVDATVYYNTSEASAGHKSPVHRVIVHPKYKDINEGYDIAMMSLAEPLHYDRYVRPICLPKKSRTLAERPVLAAGWGYTNPAGNSSDHLLYVVLKVLPDWRCKCGLHHTTAANVSSSLLLCTHTPAKDICMGDSGGPLTVWNRDGLSVQVGVVSFTFGCGSSGHPSGFTRVSGYTGWIKESLKVRHSWKKLPLEFKQ
ncbi:venom peptide isomerase heavy chain-like isoform X1 [Dermacentor andersoni]|uniref:venom peptide isomerase heavy chain-like isoform X1 n=3 Tax=Dermacentor andersoni TaxID=34620 RepID=UPI003B3A4978